MLSPKVSGRRAGFVAALLFSALVLWPASASAQTNVTDAKNGASFHSKDDSHYGGKDYDKGDSHYGGKDYGKDKDYGKGYDKDWGKDYGKDHDKDHGKDYGKDHDKDHGKDHDKDHDCKYGKYDCDHDKDHECKKGEWCDHDKDHDCKYDKYGSCDHDKDHDCKYGKGDCDHDKDHDCKYDKYDKSKGDWFDKYDKDKGNWYAKYDKDHKDDWDHKYDKDHKYDPCDHNPPPPPPPPDVECKTELCAIFGKPKKLLLVYTGKDASNIISAQAPDKVVISGDPNFDATVYIVATNGGEDGNVLFADTVNLGESFTVSAVPTGGTTGNNHRGGGNDDRLPANTFVYIYDHNPADGGVLLQSIQFHTSCSQPLRLGDEFGAVGLIGFTNKTGDHVEDASCVMGSCPDGAPPTVSYDLVDDSLIVITVTDNTGIESVTVETSEPPTAPGSGTTSALEFLGTDFVQGAKVATYTYRIVDFTHNYFIRTTAKDKCGLTPSCPLNLLPPSISIVPQQDPDHPEYGNISFGTVSARDTSNTLQMLEFFRLRNGVVYDNTFVEGGVTATFKIRRDNPNQSGSFALIVADECNATVLDPTTDETAAAKLGQLPSEAAQEFALGANFPNPFSQSTTIEFAVPEASQVHLSVYDIVGREIAVLVDQEVSAGQHRVTFGADGLPSGMYFYRLVTPEKTFVRKMTVVK